MSKDERVKDPGPGPYSDYLDLGISKMLLSIDMYKEPIPIFNIAGQTHVRSYCGGLVSFLIIISVAFIALLKL